MRSLVAGRVRFVVIGGFAGALWGSTTLTGDLDLCYERSPENLERLAAALNTMGARLRGVPEAVPFQLEGPTLAAGDSFTFVTEFGDLDIIGSPAGSGGYEQLMRAATRFDLGDLEVGVASLPDLISMKLAAGRPKDLVEAEVLGALAAERP
jgi:hypothetical protein